MRLKPVPKDRLEAGVVDLPRSERDALLAALRGKSGEATQTPEGLAEWMAELAVFNGLAGDVLAIDPLPDNVLIEGSPEFMNLLARELTKRCMVAITPDGQHLVVPGENRVSESDF